MTNRVNDPAFLYFPDHYRWSMGLLICLGGAPWGGAEIDEVNRVGRALRDKVGDDAAWFAEWTRMGEAVEARGRAAEKDGHAHTAAACLLRATRYYQTGERFMQPKSQHGLDVYANSVKAFRDAAALMRRPRIEHVEIPYQGTALPALLVHPDAAPARSGRAPAMVFFDGFDVTKEIQYGYAVPDLAARGIGCLIIDGPGNGESVRFRKLPLIAETERYATPAYEYLAGRPEFDPARIGVMALSLGGYYAPRAAALEPRFACCIAWGAQWDYHAIWQKRLDDLAAGKVLSLSVPPEHLQWVLGVSSQAAALKKLEDFKLDGIVQKMTCPFLLMHGEGDEQISLALAQKCFDAVGSKQKTLKIFTRQEGGFHHCKSTTSPSGSTLCGIGWKMCSGRAADDRMKSEVRDGMRIDWDAPITMDDGIVLCADVFRPLGDGRCPVILSYGPYAKGLPFQDGYKGNWARLIKAAPEVLTGSSNKYQVWELVDPEKWVPDGYACVRVDSRGAGRSPGYIDIWSPREAQDLYQCIEWAGTQPWSNGKVGMNGISYFATNQWQVAALQPPHLAALCIWEGFADYYRELARHGGILSDFIDRWYDRQVLNVQHGVGDEGARSKVTGERVAGPETLAPQELAKNRADPGGEAARRQLVDDYYRARMVDFEKIEVPLLSAANWGGQGLHPHGNFEGYLRAGSGQKWLEVHGDTQFTHFYSNYGIGLQKRFFGHFLKGETTGWERQPPVALNIRRPGEKFALRAENEWPLARTRWTKYYLDPAGRGLATAAPTARATLTYEATGDGLTFLTPPMTEELEITGPVAAKIWLSSETPDADVFLVLRVFDPASDEVVFIGSNDPRTPVGLGWLRASQRKLDPHKTRPWRPYHTHDERWPLVPGDPVELDIEIWPTSIVVPPGYRLGLSVRGKDYEYDGTDAGLANAPYPMKGVGPFTHANQSDRPPEIFAAQNTLYFAPGRMPYVLLPIIPLRSNQA